MKKILLFGLLSGSFQVMMAQTFKPGLKMQKSEKYEIITNVNGSVEQAGMTMPIESTMKRITCFMLFDRFYFFL